MKETGFWWILLALAGYGLLHSILAANSVKSWFKQRTGGAAYQRYYRLFFVIIAGLSFLPVLLLVVVLPDQAIYTLPSPWAALAMFAQFTALVGLGIGVLQTGALAFLGVSQALGQAVSEKLVTSGLYRWVRHPLYTFSLLLIWLSPTLTWNSLSFNIGVTAYLWIGTIFEERKLIEQFGQEYQAYRKRTPRIIPGIHI